MGELRMVEMVKNLLVKGKNTRSRRTSVVNKKKGYELLERSSLVREHRRIGATGN